MSKRASLEYTPLFDLDWAELDFEHPEIAPVPAFPTARRTPQPAAPALLEPLLPGPPDWSDALGVFDLETTGIDTDIARIVTAHVGLIDEHGAIVERKEWIIDPGEPIPAGATAVHGIDDARVRRFGRSPAEVVPEILDAIRSVAARGFPLAIYNAPYDLTLLAREAARLGLEQLDGSQLIVDALVLDRALDKYRKGKRTLELNAAFYGVPLESAHDAGCDAIAAGRVAQAIARRYPVELGVSMRRLHSMQIAWCRQQADDFQEYMRRTRDPNFVAVGEWPLR